MSLEALIFDVDGTLADTEEAHRKAFNAAFAECGLPWCWGRQLYAELLKVAGGRERISHFIAHLDLSRREMDELIKRVPAIHRCKTERYTRLVTTGQVSLRPGVEPLISTARHSGVRLAIATTTSATNVTALLRHTLGHDSIGWFAAIITGDHIKCKKPAPDVYQCALETLDLSASRCMAFEDSAIGLTAAKQAALFTVVAPTRWTAADDLTGADLLLTSLRDAGGLEALSAYHSDWLINQTVAA